MNFPRLPLAAAAMAALVAAFAAPASAAAVFQPPGWGDDPAILEFAAEFDLALERADAEAPVFRLAHAGQLSPKDSCHRHKAAGERHWHKEGSAERGGPCVKDGGETQRLTNHAVCAAARIELVKAKERWGSDYKRVAEALKDCIVALPDSGGR